jgi:hypothetical protein|tara:strand:+ start:789 stop:1109 length:321 start_codon:yes stop_codon:yes gene_type:complete
MLSSMKSGLKVKEELVQKTRNGKVIGTSTEAVVDEPAGTSYYSKTKEKGGNQKVKTFTKTESEEGPEYGMKKTYKPLFGSKYKEVDKSISASRGERKMDAMKKFMK